MSIEKLKLPAIPMYTADYLNDQKLKLCSMAAQGFWVRMLFTMHHCEPYGHLTFHNGEPATIREIAQVTGVHTNQVTPWVTELERHGVFSRTQGGVIYSRRMIRDEAIRLINKQNGYKGGNPILTNSVNRHNKNSDNPPLKASSSSDVKGLQHKPLSRKTVVKHQTARTNDTPSTAWLAPESSRQETAPPGTPPDPIREFYSWVKDHVPGWAMKAANQKWKDPDDQRALRDVFRVRAIFEIQACWYLFIRPGTKNYDYASGQRFAMEEFKRQIEFLVTDEGYPNLKRRFMEQQGAMATV